MYRLVSIGFFLCIPFVVLSQEKADMELIMDFLHVHDPQELDEYEMERMNEFIVSPVRINEAGSQKLRSTGLFSAYQVAVIDDYRSEHGDVLSLTELASLDGFGEDFVRRLAPFVTLASTKGVQNDNASYMSHDLICRGLYKWRGDSGNDGSYAFKYRVKAGKTLTAAIAVSRSAGAESWMPSGFSGCLTWKSQKTGLKLIAGDYNARFGQGLALWNSSMTPYLTAPDSFMKRPSGLSPTWSFSGSSAMTGLAAELSKGKFILSSMVAFPGVKSLAAGKNKISVMPAFNLAWYCRYGHVSCTNLMDFSLMSSKTETLATSVDMALCLRGVNVFCEASADWFNRRIKATAGTRFMACEKIDVAVLLQMFQNEQYGIASSAAFSSDKCKLYWTLDAVCYPEPRGDEQNYSLQLKSYLSGDVKILPYLWMKFKISERVRSWGHRTRTDARADLVFSQGYFSAVLRMNVLHCDKTAYAGYLEGSYSAGALSAYLRQGLFFVDDWDDRIYVYEHDVPGMFNVPALYGRGLWTSATAGYRLSDSVRIWLRASYTGYHFMEAIIRKPGRAELRLQLQFRF